MSSKIKKVIISVLVLGVLGFFGYYIYVKNSDVLTIDLISPPDTEIVGQDILVLVDKLKAVSIDPSLFKATLFTNLKDTGAPISPEAQGRSNPFRPIGSESSSASVTQTGG